VILLGMNPGPFGMAQTGVPFGEVSMVRDWLGISAPVGQPPKVHPKRPIDGFQCKRSEVSGARLWGWARDQFGTPEKFFRRFFIANYCPLVFMEESGRNRTPDKLPPKEREPLLAICDRAIRATAQILEAKAVVGVGAFAEDRATAALGGLDLMIARIPHPSPASPAANKGWAEATTRALSQIGDRLHIDLLA
jgi:single-strand selective monofunctional uracil DNA glycosylase